LHKYIIIAKDLHLKKNKKHKYVSVVDKSSNKEITIYLEIIKIYN
jgi:hypothetical protein